MLKTRKLTGIVLATFLASVLLMPGCTIPGYHQVSAADQKISEIKKIFSDADKVMEDSYKLADEVYDDSLTNDVMSSNAEEVKKKEEELKTTKENLEKVKTLLNETNSMRLPSNYKNDYLPALNAAKEKRIEQVAITENMLFKTGNLATAITDYYSAVNRLEQVGNLLQQLPEISFEQPQTIQSASDILLKVGSETELAQSELNNAAAGVNAEVFTKLRDTASDLVNVAASTGEMVKLVDLMLKATQSGNQQGFVDAYNLLPAQLEILVAALEKFEAGYPAELVDDNGDFTTKGQNQIQDWKNENIKGLFDQYDEKKKEIEEADTKVASSK